MLLNKRSQDVEYHKGEISFPGGGRDSEDKDFLDTALREVNEEMGIRAEDVTILGQLDDVVTRTEFQVRVFVGTIPYPYPFKPNATEIAEVLEVPIRELLDTATPPEDMWSTDGDSSTVYRYEYGAHVISGATARIVTQFLELLPESLGAAKWKH